MSLRAFMAEIPEKREKELVLSKRFADEQGNPVNWKIRSINAAAREARGPDARETPAPTFSAGKSGYCPAICCLCSRDW